MRYQEYKNRMLKVRRVLDVIYRLRFVIIGVTTAIIATTVTLDLTKGSITETSSFKITYKYGEKISYSGSSFMGDVDFEFRQKIVLRDGNDSWSPWSKDEPKYVGTYQARARSLGNHGYKYSDPSTFEVEPLEVMFTVKNDKVDYGDDSPALEYTLLGGDRLDNEYKVDYEDLTKNVTTASVDLSTIRIFDKDNKDITNCYALKQESKEITFNKSVITVDFADQTYKYDGDNKSFDEYTVTGNLQYGHHIEVGAGISVNEIGAHKNAHEIKVIGDDEKDYSANYDIKDNENTINIIQADPITITSNDLGKTYDGKVFAEDEFTYDIKGLLPIHTAKVTFTNISNVNVCSNQQNTFTVEILDKENNEVSNLYKSINKQFGSIDITKKNIYIKSNDLENVYFDNTEKYLDKCTYDSSDLVGDDYVEIVSYSKDTYPGIYDNVQDYKIYHDETIDDVVTKIDVTSNYNIITEVGKINIGIKPLKFNFKGQDFDYDTSDHPVYASATLDEDYKDNLPEGWSYLVETPGLYMRYYDENGYIGTKDAVTYRIWDKTGVEVTSVYEENNALDVTFGTSQINKVDLEITVNDYEKYFDNKTLKDDNINLSSSVVYSSGLKGSDYIQVDYEKDEDKSIKNVTYNSSHEVEATKVNFAYTVYSVAMTNVSSNYNISFTDDKDYTNVTINKRPLYLTTSEVYKTYDANNIFTPSIILTGGDIDDAEEKIQIKTKTYTVSDNVVGNYPYELLPSDIEIFIGEEDVTDNYQINIVNSGKVHIQTRDISFNQVSATRDCIYYDGEEHGVFIDSNEVSVQKVSSQNPNVGLLEGHHYEFATEYKYIDPSTHYIYSSDIDITILDENDNDVTTNYSIYSDSFNINIVQKKIYIYSTSKDKRYDGETFDINADLEFDTYYDIDDLSSSYSYEILGMNNVKTTLNEGHTLQVTKTNKSVVDGAINVGYYSNEYDYRVIDESGNDVSTQYAFEIYVGTLTINQAVITVQCDVNTKSYDGNPFVQPSDTEFEVTSKSVGVRIYRTTVGPKFFDNHKLYATLTPGAVYDNYFTAGTYTYTPTYRIYDVKNDLDLGEGNSNITIDKRNDGAIYQINPIAISLAQKLYKNAKGEVIMDIRTLTKGNLMDGDVLYFGSEKLDKHKKTYVAEFLKENITIKRGEVDVTDCYNITLSSS